MISSQLCGGNVALLDCSPNLLPALRRGDLPIALELFRVRSEVGVFDHAVEPLRVVASMQMEQPRLIIHAVRELQERGQIVCAEIQFAVRSLEIETLFGIQRAFRVFATMTTALSAGLFRANPEGGLPRL